MLLLMLSELKYGMQHNDELITIIKNELSGYGPKFYGLAHWLPALTETKIIKKAMNKSEK